MVQATSKRFAVISMMVAICIHAVAIQPLSANDILPHRPATLDTSAQSDGMIRGRLVDPRGNGVSQSMLRLHQGNQVFAKAETDASGRFVIPSPPPGGYQLTDGRWVQSLRIWAPGTAPPAAGQEILIVAPGPVIAGQVAPLRYWMSNPNVMLATAAIAIAIPIILFNVSQDNAAS